MNELADLQRAYQRAIAEDAQSFAQWVVATGNATAMDRIAVYRDAYRLRLRDGLGANYPRLRQLLGEDAFASIADAYIEAHPSRNTSIRWFGARLPDELRRAFSSKPWLGELAQWEWAIASAFDAPDARRVSMLELAKVEGDSWPILRFKLHASVQCLRMNTNAPALFKSSTEDSRRPEPMITEETAWLIWRDDLTTRFRSMSEAEAAALATLMRGEPFEVMCTELCVWYAADDVAQQAAALLGEWINAGIICDFFQHPRTA